MGSAVGFIVFVAVYFFSAGVSIELLEDITGRFRENAFLTGSN